MCGIAGILTPGRPIERRQLERMVASMAHRGPDGTYLWHREDVALGVRRLAIVDVPGGAQPLANESGTVQVLFNGEIYNHEALRRALEAEGHVLASRTDGAVIPHLYEQHGDDLFERLDGIFAIALWDTANRRLLLARDRIGVKPLYLHRHARELRFASELRALLTDPSVPRELDLHALDQHLTFRYTPAPRTLLAGVDKLTPSTVLCWHEGKVVTKRYGRSAAPPPTKLSFAAAAEAFRGQLRGAVHRQLMSDRPVGVMLSGGLDSAAVVALAAERSSHTRTFTVGFEGGGDADETALARQTARLFGTDHREQTIGDAEFLETLPRVIEMLEEPVATSSALGHLAVARLAREHGVPVLLSGQGADELLGGYWRYVGEWLAGTASHIPLARAAARVSALVRNGRLERGLRALSHADALTRLSQIYAVFTNEQKLWLYRPELAHQTTDADAFAPVQRLLREADGRTTLDQMMYVDLRQWLPDDLLLVGDKMAMAASVEMRVPFLDNELVDLVESLPSSYKLRHGRRKAIEKAALAPLLPAAIIRRKERGFVTPIDRWLRSGMRPFAREVLLAPDSCCAGLFRTSAIEALLERHAARRHDHTRQIFCLLSFELWARSYLRAT
jgi:asparagine synthase (glutamine-hydrolysing)